MPRVDAARADHGAFAAEHAGRQHPVHFGVLSALQAEQDLPDAHPRPGRRRAGGAAAAAADAGERVGYEPGEPVEAARVHRVQVDGRTGAEFESEIHPTWAY